MSLPGFTAEVSLYKTQELYYATESISQNDQGVYPAKFLAAPFPGNFIDFSVPFLEPQCWRICLRSWGGDCRLICF
jgi:hypothetical protein